MGKSGEKMFIGQFEHTIDEKNRVAIPAKFRKTLKGSAVITKGLDGCLFLFPKEKFDKMASGIGELPLSKSSARLYGRLMLASAAEVDFDNQGRIVMPAYLKTYAKITKDTFILGIYDRVEIWDKKIWQDLSRKTDKKAEAIIEDLSELGI